MESELLLWRWSVGVQWASLGMITVFFVALARSGGWAELRSWVLAWAADLVALGVTFLSWYVRPTGHGFHVVAGAMLFRSAFSLVQSASYAAVLRPASVSPDALSSLRSFLSTTSFVDALAEWLLALAAVLALSDRVQRALHQYNRDLLTAQEELRRLADRDPLTALDNRRSLPEIFRAVQPHGALLLFFDLDDFKLVNDRYGHQVGDECLRRFAIALRECFRPSDALVRYAGDEFLVVASGVDAAAARDRVARVREKLAASEAEGPHVAFSVGLAELPPGGLPEAALKAADESMYRAKSAPRLVSSR
jgi:diguanylate cyclase (GGDEF)-like protein